MCFFSFKNAFLNGQQKGQFIEDKSKSNYQTWSLARIREILTKLMRSTCLCKNGPSHSTTSGSLAEQV